MNGTGSNLTGARLIKTKLAGAVFDKAVLTKTVLTDAAEETGHYRRVNNAKYPVSNLFSFFLKIKTHPTAAGMRHK